MSDDAPTLVLIDGHALAYRAFHALPANMTSQAGEPTNASFGFTSMLLQVLETHQPDYIAVTFDRGLTGRDERFPEYKANRAETPEALDLQMAHIRAMVEALAIPIYEVEGWEADDVLGTLAPQAAAQGVETLIVTGDTDTFQLVDEHTRVVTSGRRFSDIRVYDEERVRERYGVEPEQLPQWKGLKGDSSDNIPGVPGIGKKTATTLVQDYGTVENAIAHLDDISAKRARENLRAHAEQATLSVELVTIRRDAPVTLDLERCAVGGFDRQALMSLMRRLDFRSLVDRLPEVGGSPLRPEESDETTYEVVRSVDALAALAERLTGAERLAFDTETTSVDQMQAALVGIALTDTPGRGWYLPVGHGAGPADENGQERLALGADGAGNLPLEAVREQLAPVFAGDGLKIAHNLKYDLLVLERHGFEIAPPTYDTMVAAWLIEPGRRAFSLKDLTWTRLGFEMTPIKELIGSGRGQITMAEVTIDEACPYACADVDMTLRLAELQQDELDERGARELFDTVEMPLVHVLADMERAGMPIDRGALEDIRAELESRIEDLETEIHSLAGHPFNVGSPQQLSEVLFEELGLPPARRTKTGYSTAADVLTELEDAHPIVGRVLEWRHLTKLKGTYVDALPQLINPETGRIHTSFHQTAVVTGRLSSSDPNLQNIPVRSDVGGQIRRAFRAPQGHLLLAADYSQVELRILAALSGDPALLEVFRTGGDVHAATAAFLFDKPADAVTSNERRIAKTVNFGTVYGISSFGLAARTGLSREEAGEFIERYFERYAGVRDYFDQLIEQAAERGYVETILGRRRYFPELTEAGPDIDHNTRRRAEREAVNAPLQGSAADITKVAMLRLAEALQARGLEAALLLQVHDELLLELPEAELPEVATLTRDTMQAAAELDVALEVDLAAGPSWGELTGYTPPEDA